MIRRLGIVIGCVGLLGGCGKQSDSERAVFNEPIGAGPAGAPTSVGRIDETINKDFSGYKPIGVPTEAGPAAADTAAGSGAETDAVRAAVQAPIDALGRFDAAGLLDAFVPEKVAALRSDFESELGNALAALQNLGNVAKAKAPDVATPADTLHQLKTMVTDALIVTITDPTTANVRLDGARLADGLVGWYQSQLASAATGAVEQPPPVDNPRFARSDRMVERSGFVPEGGVEAVARSGGGAPAAGLPPGVAMPSPDDIRGYVAVGAAMVSLTVRKVDNSWRIDVPTTLSEDHADAMTALVDATKQAFQKMTERIDAAPQADPATMQAIQMQVMGETTPLFLSALARVQAAFAGPGEPRTPSSSPDDPTESAQPVQP